MPVITRPREYQQIQALRDVTGSNFPNGQIRYQFSVSRGMCWNPYLSFFRIRTQLQTFHANNRADDNNIVGSSINNDKIAPNIFFPDSLFQQLEFYINGTCVNKQDNYVHQIAAIRHRQNAEIKNETYELENFTQPNINSRINQVIKGGGSTEHTAKLIPLFPSFYPGASDGVGGATTFSTYSLNQGGIGQDASTTRIFFYQQANGLEISDTRDIFNIGESIYFLDQTGGQDNAANQYRSRIIKDIIFADPDGAANPPVPDRYCLIVDTNNGIDTIISAGQNAANANDIDPVSFYKNIAIPTYYGRQLDKWENIWKPGLGIFQTNQWLPAGDYEIILTPHPRNSFQKLAIESYSNLTPALGDSAPTVNSPYKINIVSMEMYICKCQSNARMAELIIDEMRCQVQTLNTASLTQKQYNVEPESYALTVAYQDNRVVSDTRFSTGKFKIDDDLDLKVERVYIQFRGKVLPNPIPDPNFNVNAEDYLTARYAETQLYNTTIYDSNESYEQWKQRGPYYHFQWPADEFGDSTEVQLYQQFQQGIFDNQAIRPQAMLFSHYLKRYSLTYDSVMGNISGVTKL